MKNSMLNLVKGGVFLLAMIAAFAFTQPVVQGPYHYDEDTEEWTDLSGVEYSCDQEPQEVCTYASEDLDDPFQEGRIDLNP
ncbi:hypothetical protein FKX85_06585 [Echinicola soli]|uniref:Secreted protein n=1 Tax=Echinicola soli TaxID=2591634 RepID=A0A514CFY0_9BACT|nr:hypothetical protein [Echinicola soli]QDH78719.1 hypothetical protein FKX85_06585 [Echinicola soli]